MNKSNHYDVVVIGGGASGMMAAVSAAKTGAKTLLLEKNKRLGEKLRITGGGRCNVTNAEHDTRILLANYGQAQKFLHSAFSRYGVQDTIDYFEAQGVKVKIEARKRAFPASNSADDIADALVKDLRNSNVVIMQNANVDGIDFSNGQVDRIRVDGRDISATSYILATGGSSRPETGSTGDGFSWLRSMGLDVRRPTPNITPLKSSVPWLKDVSGTKLLDARVTYRVEGQKPIRVQGDVLLTHFGLSGPTILNSANQVSDLLQAGEVTAYINCYPGLDQPALDAKLREAIDGSPAKNIGTILVAFAPTGLKPMLEHLLEGRVNLTRNASEVSRESRLAIVDLLQTIPVPITGLMGFEKAVVADGGLNLTEVDTRSMQVKSVPNLFVTGDLLDINRPSGGYSLQLCWTSGYIAGTHASRNI